MAGSFARGCYNLTRICVAQNPWQVLEQCEFADRDRAIERLRVRLDKPDECVIKSLDEQILDAFTRAGEFEESCKEGGKDIDQELDKVLDVLADWLQIETNLTSFIMKALVRRFTSMLQHLFGRYRDQNLTSEELEKFRALPFGEVEHLLRLHPPGTKSLIDCMSTIVQLSQKTTIPNGDIAQLLVRLDPALMIHDLPQVNRKLYFISWSYSFYSYTPSF